MTMKEGMQMIPSPWYLHYGKEQEDDAYISLKQEHTLRKKEWRRASE